LIEETNSKREELRPKHGAEQSRTGKSDVGEAEMSSRLAKGSKLLVCQKEKLAKTSRQPCKRPMLIAATTNRKEALRAGPIQIYRYRT
jgi:hypothetical protein